MAKTRTLFGSLLGYYVDGWADLIEGMGSMAKDVRADVLKQLKERNMPDVAVQEVRMEEGVITSKKHRDYAITTTFPGVTTTIYVAEHGSDLFASWRTFIRATINWVYMVVYCGVALVLAFLINIQQIQQIFSIFTRPDIKESTYIKESNNNVDLLNLILYFGLIIGIYYLLVLIDGIVKLIAKRNIYTLDQLKWHILKSEVGENFFLLYVTIALILGLLIAINSHRSVVAKELGMHSWDEVCTWFSDSSTKLINVLQYAIVILLITLILVAIAGLITKQNLLAFILKEPSLFDKEDIAAMSLTVHKTLLRALDMAGIDVSELRLKGQFKAGRRGEEI